MLPRASFTADMSHDLLTLPRPKTLGAFIKARRVVLVSES